ncbi:MAG TPA: hypothetical protein VFF06_28395 [Polyangia bacterium]|nr:hypothetical protein [Polyangia bacterium]
MGKALALVLLAGCAGTTPPAEHPPARPTASNDAKPTAAAERAPDPHDKWKSRAADAACAESLKSLVDGALDAFHGLARCGRIDAEGTLGSSGDQPSKFEQFGEYRVYPHAGGSVMVWFLADDIRVMQLLYPKLPRPLKAQLGEPEAKVKSELSPEWDQWIYASRGLTAHVKRASGEVISLFAYRPSTVDAFLKTDIARVSKSEAPLEELK